MTVPPPNPEYCVSLGQVLEGRPCTVEGTIYGYKPDLAANIFFAAFFTTCFVWQLYCGIQYRTWTFMIGLCLGCIGEAVGYGGRIMMYNDVFDDDAFIIQICCLIIAPAFVSAGIYLTLKHIVIIFGEQWSRLPPVWYTRIFITGDIFSLVLQGAGGGLASTADPGSDLQDIGTNLMIAGVIFQVVILAFFAWFLTEYVVRTYRRRDQLSDESMALFQEKSFQCFMGAILVAFVCIFVRCVYRIPELTGGWRSELMRHELEFIVLEGVMIVIAVAVLTVCHPGYCFTALGDTIGKNMKHAREKSSEDSDVEMMSIR